MFIAHSIEIIPLAPQEQDVWKQFNTTLLQSCVPELTLVAIDIALPRER